MDQNKIRLLFALLRSAISGTSLQNSEKELLSAPVLNELFVLSKKHDIAHLFAAGLDKNSLLQSTNDAVKEEIFRALYRYSQLNYDYMRLCNALEAAHIPFIPLKGSVLRQWYPEPWMRTSCDIDILVHREHLEQAMAYLTENLAYTVGEWATHDVSLFSKNGNHIELHYDLVEDGRANLANHVLIEVWNHLLHKEGYEYWFRMADEMFYFYHIAHMAKHFEQGGCGIRPFIDLWILDRMKTADQNKRDALLEEGGLLKFAEAARQLNRIWFEQAEYTDITARLEQYIINGGVYGSDVNRIAVQQQKQGGRFKYALSKIFLPYDTIKFHYPILQKHRWLTPIMQVRRWFKLIFCGHAKRSVWELKQNSNISAAEAEDMQTFLKDIGL